jgi:antitoxin (DNA-binding transcriptional repressor) of toxin-antitoxin stability system
MSDVYSTYEAKARFSEIIRKVREGKTMAVTYRGELVAEIRPWPEGGASLEDRD